jgi:NAD(P)-dependent dehydrogenase (short-subunit alcohol dehydrogenase family)
MRDFGGKLAVITGGGTGMGRELARQLIAEGCDVAICDVIEENMNETRVICEGEAPQGVKISAHACDVSNEQDVLRFRDEVIRDHGRDYVNLLFNNAGIGGTFSFLDEANRAGWERTFNICWNGVYNCARAFMPLLVAADEAHLVNTSSVNGFWATLGPGTTHTAYCAAKFAVKGFSEALITDLRDNAPHVKVSVVMPGHIGTSIAINSGKVLGQKPPEELDAEDVAAIRERQKKRGLALDGVTDEQIRELVRQQGISFRDNAPTTAAQAAADILKGVKEERWRILLGHDAAVLDRMVREDPENAYEPEFMDRLRTEAGWQLG